MTHHARHARHRARTRATRGLVTGAAAVGLVSTSLAGHAYASAQDPSGPPASPGSAAPVTPASAAPSPGPAAVRDDLNAAMPERLAALEPLAALDPLAAESAPPTATAPPPPAPPAVVTPVAGDYRITATYGAKGHRWSGGRHTGLDFAGASGTPIAAAAAGTIVEAGRSGPYGNRVVIQHDDGTATSYSHLSRITVAAGRVQAGAVIGLLGSTGNSTGPHLHFEAAVGGALVDPRDWLAARGVLV